MYHILGFLYIWLTQGPLHYYERLEHKDGRWNLCFILQTIAAKNSQA